MFRGIQFTVATIMGLMAAVAALIVSSAWWVTVAIIEIIAILFCTTALTRNLPAAIQKSLTANCQRPDGSWSVNRARIEMRALRKLKRGLCTVFVMVTLATNALLWFVNSEIIPLSVGFDALTSFRLSEQAWKENLRDQEKRLERWGKNKNLSNSEIGSQKRMLWNLSPLMLMVGLAWVAAAFLIIQAAYFQSLKELFASVQFRAEQYALRDLHATVSQHEHGR